MSRQLLIDYIPFSMTPQQINESLMNNNGRLILSGPIQRAGIRNQNGRIYPKKILMREAKKYAETYITENRALGELDHPDSSVINLKNVSHNILKMWWKGDDLMGQLEILTTPAGNILKELLKAGIRVGISSRGLGSVKPIGEDNTVEVQEDFEIIGWDIVSNPSTQGAFMKPITEGADELQKQLNKYVGIHKIINDILKGE